jgi:hypothetical protein
LLTTIDAGEHDESDKNENEKKDILSVGETRKTPVESRRNM